MAKQIIQPSIFGKKIKRFGHVEIENALFQRTADYKLTANNTRIIASLTPNTSKDIKGPWLDFEINDHPAIVQLNWNTVRRIVGIPLEAADKEDAALVFEDSLSPWLDEIEEILGLSIRLKSFATIKKKSELALYLPVAIRTVGLSAKGQPIDQKTHMLLSPEAAKAIANGQYAHLSPRKNLEKVCVRICLELQSSQLTLAELHSLSVGDALLLETDKSSARLMVENQYQATVKHVSGNEWQLAESLAPRVQKIPDNIGNTTMDETNPKPEQNTPKDEPIVQSFDDIEVRMSFRLGEKMVALSELKTLAPGANILLDQSDGSQVDIVVNGQVIGKGEVISVSGQRAIEIRKLFKDG